MATVDWTPTVRFENLLVVVWADLASTDSGDGLEVGNFSDMCVQFGGNFGAGGTVVFEGSNDGLTWFTLNDAQGSAISKTSAALEQVIETPRFVRPRVTAGDGTTAIDVTLATRQGRADV